MPALTPDAEHLLIESWTLFAVTFLLIAARMISRRLLLNGWTKLKWDDYIMMVITVTLVMVMVSVNQVAQNLSNYLPAGMVQTLTPDQISNAIYGSKFVFILEQFQLATLYLCKACLLILYSQMTSGLPKQHRFVKIVGAYCVLGYVVTNVCFLAVWCRPIQQYWAVPPENSQCASYYHHLVTASVFNISSDLVMLLIPLPMLIKARLPLKRKAVLCAVFSLGVFVVLAAILNRYYNFTEPYGSLVYLNWYAGEAATAVMVANVPHCWPILSRVFRLGSFKSTSMGNQSTGNRYKFTNSSVTGAQGSRRRPDEHGYLRSDSEEQIAQAGKRPGFASKTHSTGGPIATTMPVSDNSSAEMEMGNITHGEPQIGTAVSAGGHDAPPYRGPLNNGHILKTVSMNQTYSDEKY